jgi:hypothetical protein
MNVNALNQALSLPQNAVSAVKPPRVTLTVVYTDSASGQNYVISEKFMECLLDLTYRERLTDGKQEYTLNVSLADPDGFFRSNLTFDVWASLDLTVHQPVQWGMVRQINRLLPRMFISGMEMTSNKSSGTTMHLTCSSIPGRSQFRTQRSFVAYPSSDSNESSDLNPTPDNASVADDSGDDIGSENTPETAPGIAQPKRKAAGKTDLRSIAADVAKRNGLQLRYLTTVKPVIARFDAHHSQSKTLDRLCVDNNLFYSNKDGYLIIASMADVVARKPVATITCPTKLHPGGLNGQGLTSWTFSKNVEDTYGECECSYHDPTSGDAATATAIDRNQSYGTPRLIDTTLPNEFGEDEVWELDREPK